MRIAICQPLVPHYRVPAFNLLGSQPGIELTVFAGSSTGSLEAITTADHFKIVPASVHLRQLGSLYFKFQQAQIDAIDPRQFDLAILPWDNHYVTAFQAVRKARRLGFPIVLWGHGYSKKPHAVPTWIRNRLGKRASAVLLYTQTIADRLISQYGFRADRVFVAPNALDQIPIQQARLDWLARPEDLRGFQAQHALDPAQTVIFVSRLEPDNNVSMLINAFDLLRRKRPAAKLVLVGHGSDQARLQEHVTRLGLQSHVIFTGPIYLDHALTPWMLSSTVFCYPVNIGLSIHHAFSFGLPVVTSDNIPAHNPSIELHQNGINGLLYRDGDTADMLAKLDLIMADPLLRAKMSQAALRQVTHHYTVPNMVQGFLDATIISDGIHRTVVLPPPASPLYPITATSSV